MADKALTMKELCKGAGFPPSGNAAWRDIRNRSPDLSALLEVTRMRACPARLSEEVRLYHT